ncbi:hypothetical protein [Microcoleus sp. MON1_C1]|uniref:hypothetical protein n=1 Tax=Microcoleus sp. MON1_C1 TaxID=2818827 RepID=UPI004040BAA1
MLGKLQQQGLIVRDRHLGLEFLTKVFLRPPRICLAATLQQYSKRQPFAST